MEAEVLTAAEFDDQLREGRSDFREVMVNESVHVCDAVVCAIDLTDVVMDELSLKDVTVGPISFGGETVIRKISLENVECGGICGTQGVGIEHLVISSSRFWGGICFEAVTFQDLKLLGNVKIHGNLVLGECVVDETLMIDGVQVTGNLDVARAVVNDVHTRRLEVKGEIRCDGNPALALHFALHKLGVHLEGASCRGLADGFAWLAREYMQA